MRKLAAHKLFSASGGFIAGDVAKIIRFSRKGCANRPFFHIVVAAKKREEQDQCIEQIGSIDIMPNQRNEKLVAINLERLSYWLGQGIAVSKPVSQLLGLCGYFPIHPRTYMRAWRNRRHTVAAAEAAEQAAAEAAKKESATT